MKKFVVLFTIGFLLLSCAPATEKMEEELSQFIIEKEHNISIFQPNR